MNSKLKDMRLLKRKGGNAMKPHSLTSHHKGHYKDSQLQRILQTRAYDPFILKSIETVANHLFPATQQLAHPLTEFRKGDRSHG